jgi:hypothetical protein
MGQLLQSVSTECIFMFYDYIIFLLANLKDCYCLCGAGGERDRAGCGGAGRGT